ncbi:beta-galactosidase [Microbacteriaceae bacterium VKM Ac-2854]|nr:beta-galactosidase [Microbacteriaceae bacterium VKM Ac-2854]
MSTAEDRHERVRLSSRHIEIDGRPVIPVSGELHYSRVPRERWAEELRLLLASGITLVSTYVFWIHHEPVRGAVSFEGDLDLAAFLETADRVGIDVVLRIGPWAHGEARNGGFPDWLLEAAPVSRTDDPEYLELVEQWFARIAEQAARFCGPRGRIVGIQIENELYDQPQHIATLKRLARAAGLTAPLWTATAWGGAELPAHEVFPLYSGYADGFWADQGSVWDDSFRDHFAFTHVWDDPGVGGDQREAGLAIVVRDVDPEFPPATCELGGGMATAYHRRPIARGADIAAVANVKLGNGSLWQGFYMYVGGVNPGDGLQESHASGYPNDLPRFDYDFQAPIGATGQPGPSLSALREHNAFVASFGARLAGTYSTLPDGGPVDVHDLDSLRWAVRSDGRSGFVFINTHQPHEPLSGVAVVQLRIGLDDGELLVPERPIDIPSGVIARWPLRLDVAGVRLDWATASVIGVVEGELPTLVLKAHTGLDARIRLRDGSRVSVDGSALVVDGALDLRAGVVLEVDGALRILVVDEAQAERLWFSGGELIESEHLVWHEDGALVARAAQEPLVARWTGTGFEPVGLRTSSTAADAPVGLEPVRAAGAVPARYGERGGRSSAPTDAQFDEVAAVWRLDVPEPGALHSGDRVELIVAWEGDVAQLRADGALIGDRFWDGRDWRIDLSRLAPDAELTLHVAPISSAAVIDLDAAVRARLDAAGTLGAVIGVRLERSVRWSAADGAFG